jgi:hypothetical protein
MCAVIKNPITKLMAAMKKPNNKPTAKPATKRELIKAINKQSCELLCYHLENKLIAAEIIEKSSSELIKILKGEICKKN